MTTTLEQKKKNERTYKLITNIFRVFAVVYAMAAVGCLVGLYFSPGNIHEEQDASALCRSIGMDDFYYRGTSKGAGQGHFCIDKEGLAHEVPWVSDSVTRAHAAHKNQ